MPGDITNVKQVLPLLNVTDIEASLTSPPAVSP
jgi:hypothetical protein